MFTLEGSRFATELTQSLTHFRFCVVCYLDCLIPYLTLALAHELIRITTKDMIAEYLLANYKKKDKKNQSNQRKDWTATNTS